MQAGHLLSNHPTHLGASLVVVTKGTIFDDPTCEIASACSVLSLDISLQHGNSVAGSSTVYFTSSAHKTFFFGGGGVVIISHYRE